MEWRGAIKWDLGLKCDYSALTLSGSDLGPIPGAIDRSKVSIPPSPWGERHYTGRISVKLRYFNPRPPCGERRVYLSLFIASSMFQSTPPCGERLRSDKRIVSQWQFQSAPPCGERHRNMPIFWTPYLYMGSIIPMGSKIKSLFACLGPKFLRTFYL